MAIGKNAQGITWGTPLVTAGNTEISNAVLTTDAAFTGSTFTLKAANAGTPATDDIITFYMSKRAKSTDDYPSVLNSNPLGSIDTNATDPDSLSPDVPTGSFDFKIIAVSSASSNSITVSGSFSDISG